MNNLFILVGASGVGKSEITQYIRNKRGGGFNCIKKYTTRPVRKEETRTGINKELDLIFLKNKKPCENEIKYKRGGFDYWVDCNKVLLDIKQYKNNFIIFSDFYNAIEIKRKFIFDVNCIIIYIHCDFSVIKERMEKLDYTPQEIDFRINRTKPIWKEFLEQNARTVQHTIINGSNINDLYTQIDKILELYN